MKRVFNLIIVDQSGSMEIIRKQAFMGINETLETIVKLQKKNNDIEQHITLMTFDSTSINFIYDNELSCSIHNLSYGQYIPGGATPLYDAIGSGISKLNAITSDKDNVLVTIITDGEENSSNEYNLTMINNLISKLKRSGWTFTLIGTDNLNVEGIAISMGIEDHLSFKEDEEKTKVMFNMVNDSRVNYNTCLERNATIPSGKHFSRKKV